MTHTSRYSEIRIHADAPPKPDFGTPCNGCGVCCSAEPCPLGALLSRRLRGPCKALEWDASQARYVCGALACPERHLRWLPTGLARRLVQRWISAGSGCDADYTDA